MAPTETNMDATVLRMAGTIAAGLVPLVLQGTGADDPPRPLAAITAEDLSYVAYVAVDLARALVQQAATGPAPAKDDLRG